MTIFFKFSRQLLGFNSCLVNSYLIGHHKIVQKKLKMPLREVRGQHETHLRLDRVLSQSGKIFAGFLLNGEEPISVAVKGGPDIKREIELLRKIGAHPNIVQLVDTTREGDEEFAVFELCKGSVKDIAPLSDGAKIKTLVAELIQVLSYLHLKKQILHGALSESDHLLMTQDWQLKLSGFSSAIPMRNLNDARADLQDVVPSVVVAAVGAQTRFEPQIALQNPQYLVSILSVNSNLTRNESIQLASMLTPLLQGHVKASDLEKHIFLQTPEQNLRFIDGCKDFLMSRRNYTANSRLESAQTAVVGTNWQSQGHLTIMMEGRRYDRSITDLLRLIRNKGEHYSSLPSYIKQSMGHPLEDPECFLGYFTALFPGLIAWTWHCMYEFRKDANLRAFYPEDGSYLARVPIQQIISG